MVRGRAKQIPEAVRREIERLKALYDGFHYRELARILFIKYGDPIDHKTVKTIWQSIASQIQLGVESVTMLETSQRRERREVMRRRINDALSGRAAPQIV